jgi:hypothetical protein
MNYWRVPRMFEGGTVAVFATGPSLTQEVVDKVRDAGVPAIAVNDAYKLAPWASILYAADIEWWLVHAEATKDFAGVRVGSQPGRVEGIVFLKRTGDDGFDRDPGNIRFGRNSGYGGVHIALHTGASRILLCGFDMHDRNGTHFFGMHKEPLRNPTANRFLRWIRRFPALNHCGAQIINCTPGSALKCFPMVALDESL